MRGSSNILNSFIMKEQTFYVCVCKGQFHDEKVLDLGRSNKHI